MTAQPNDNLMTCEALMTPKVNDGEANNSRRLMIRSANDNNYIPDFPTSVGLGNVNSY